MMTSLSAFFYHFFKIFIFLVVSGVKGQKKVQNDKKFCRHAPYLRNHTSYDCHLWYHSHKKRIVWKQTNRNLYAMLKFTERPKTPGITSKNMAFPEGNKLFAGDFRTNLDETNTDMVQFTKRWNV